MRRASLVGMSAAVALAGCNAYAPAPYSAQHYAASGDRQCFWASNVSGFRQGPGDIVYVNTNSRDFYELRTLNYCASRLDFENRIALRSRAGGFICTGQDAEIFVPDALGATYCPVHATRKLSPEEVTALRAARR